MNYINGFVAAVATVDRQKYLDYARMADQFFRDNGATRVVECWGTDVPDGKVTSFPMAVKASPDETIGFSWIEWPSKEVADKAMAAMMQDERFDPRNNPMPFDGPRMIYGGFEKILDV